MDKKPVRVLIVGVPSGRTLWAALKQLEEQSKVVLEMDFKYIEGRAEAASRIQRSLYNNLCFADECDKPTKHEVGVYASMFGVPAKTYTPPHKRKGKRK